LSEKSPDSEIKQLVATLEKSLLDEEKRTEVDDLLKRFSEIKREDFIKRYASLARYIEDLCGKDTSSVLFRILSLSVPEVEKTLEQIENDDIRKWLKELNSKYVAVYEGVFPPIPHDWYRVLWTKKVDFTHGNIPFIEATILKRNGESVFLEMPFSAMVTLINHLLKQVCETKEVKVLEIPGMQEKLKQTKEIIESVLKS